MVLWAEAHRPEYLRRMAHISPSGRRFRRFWLPGGGYDRNIWTAEELHQKIAYMHANPVRRGLVEDLGDWPWSSWRAWEYGTDDPIGLDKESLPVLER